MNWRDNLREASYKGVKFHYEDAADTFGKRLAKHMYPGKDVGNVEELGASLPEVTLNIYFLGDRHIEQSEDFVDVCVKPGAGTLVHPYLGSMEMTCETGERSFSTREGGMARIKVTFVAPGRREQPRGKVESASLVTDAATSFESAADATFLDAYDIDGTPEFVAEDMADRLDDIVSASADEAQSVGRDVQTAAAYAVKVAQAAANSRTLVRDPAALVGTVADLIVPLAKTPPAVAYTDLAAYGRSATVLPAVTPTRAAQATSRNALDALVRSRALAAAVRSAVAGAYPTGGDVTAVRDVLTGMIDDEMMSAPDRTFPALQTMHAATVRYFTRLAPSRPQIVRYTPVGVQPALALAYELYGDNPSEVIERAGEIATRNGVRHPGLVPAGDPLEVLTRVR